MIRLTLMICVGLICVFAHAEESGNDLYKRSVYYWEQAQENVQKIGSQCMDCQLFQAGRSAQPKPPKQSQSCKATWDKFYDKSVIDIRVLMGYLDFGKTVHDFRTAQAMIDIVNEPCMPGANLCGFRRDPRDPSYFRKSIVVNGKRKTVRLMIAWSSLSEDDDVNTGRKARAGLPPKDQVRIDQRKRAKEMETLFYDSLVNADATFYFGHARFGAGPDFSPPKRLANGERDNAYYKNPKNQVSRARMLQTLKDAPKHNQLLGLFGCDADQHFGSAMTEAAPGMGIMAPTGLAYPESGTAQLYGALDSVLGRRCEAEFDAATNSIKKIELDFKQQKKIAEVPVPPIKMTNFFE